MARIDLDDLPPKIAALLTGLSEGEELLLVQGGTVVGRLSGASVPAPSAEPTADLGPGEIFEQFRSAIEDEF